MKELFNEEKVEAISQMAWSQTDKEDELLWMANFDGYFSVKSCFKILDEGDSGENISEVWKGI